MTNKASFMLSGLAALTLICASMSFVMAQDSDEGKEAPAKETPAKDDSAKDEGDDSGKEADEETTKPDAGDAKEGDDGKDAASEDSEEGSDDEKDEEEEEETYSDPANFEALMKNIGRAKRVIKKAERDKNEELMAKYADQIRFYAGLILDKDTDADRTGKDDYKEWSADLEEKARDLRKLAEEKKPDWDDIEEAWEEVEQVCKDCHVVYEEDE